jgi:high-affinity iron transporter
MTRAIRRLARLAATLATGFALACFAAGDDDATATALHLLDYIAVDYPNAAQDGQVKSADEYKEMTEFSGTVARLVAGLPDNPERAALAADGEKLVDLVTRKADAAQVAQVANALQAALVRAYRVAVAPRHVPDARAGAELYAEHCAGCHGATGRGDGKLARGLEPAPANLLDRARMERHSPFSLYNTITLGVQGTAMRSFREIGDDQRWALAFHVAALSAPQAVVAHGESLWKAGRGRAEFATLATVVGPSPRQIAEQRGADDADIQAYLLAHPQALASAQPAPLEFAADQLAASVAAYRKGDRENAMRLAIQAYLEGYELAEASLANVDGDLMRRGERAMMDVRGAIQSGAPVAEVEARAREAQEALVAARERLSGEALSGPATFTAALIILLREGLEAVLVLAAIFAFLGKAGRADAKRYVHAGWIAALVLGALTWLVSSELITISGANREVTEGVTALIASAMLLYVGFWLHDKAHADAWQKFISTHVGGALSTGTVWTLATISFLAVYREIFETVLFYQALASQAGPEGHGALLGGIATGAVALGVTTWAILRGSARLPLGPFFTGSALLLAVLAVVFTGQGIAALQEASWIGVRPLGSVRIPMLGVFPTLQTLAAQAAVAIVIALGLWWMRRGASATPSASH